MGGRHFNQQINKLGRWAGVGINRERKKEEKRVIMTVEDLKVKFEKCSNNLSLVDQILNAELSSDAQSVMTCF